MNTTIIVPVSRRHFLDRFFKCLEDLTCDPLRTNLLVYVDGDLQLFEKARNLTVHSKFRQKLCVYRNKGLANVSSFMRRRQRIADIHNEIKGLIRDCDYIFLTEDDTILPTDALQKLHVDLATRNKVGFVSGVQLGRWGFTMIGGWRVDNIYDPQVITSIAKGEGIEEVDAAGFYCCLMEKDRYLNHHFQPFEKMLGPDSEFGFALRQIGYKNYINHTIHCTHMTLKGDITLENSEIMQVVLAKDKQAKMGYTQRKL